MSVRKKMSASLLPKKVAPWVAGLQAARANFLPALLIQGIILTLFLGYFYYPPTAFWLNKLAELKADWGYRYSALAALIAGGLIPEIMRVVIFQKGRATRKNGQNLIFTCVFWAHMGMLVDAFYRLQAHLFGAEATFAIVATKVAVDQLVYSVFIATPLTCWLYDWKNGAYRFTGTRRFFTLNYFREVCVPVIFANWGVWIPIVSVTYSLPSLLQIPVFSLALSLWVILYTWISEQRKEPPAAEINLSEKLPVQRVK